MIIQAFLRWVEQASASNRARAAAALGRAYATGGTPHLDRNAAEMGMTLLLDDPAPQVRQALAEALADCPHVPRAIILSLAQDRAETAYTVISRSPVLTDHDLVELVARGSAEIRALIAARHPVRAPLAAAIAEIGDEIAVSILIENAQAQLTARTLARLAERFRDHAAIRGGLLARADLPAAVRAGLTEAVSEALAGFSLVARALGADRAARITREACDVATIHVSAAVPAPDMIRLVEHLRLRARLTPAFLLQALCAGKVALFAEAMVCLTGMGEARVRAILSGGSGHAVRAMIERAGLGRDVSGLYMDAVLLWRRENRLPEETGSVPKRLLARLRDLGGQANVAPGLAEIIEKLDIAEQRRQARRLALDAA
ncbi:hypothetical protein BJF92_22540 [Rhizobium rhizosphaerae]|uniref:DUF2336 domain-containing protein n=1 Tax=Xaviernesmea rhizosphaerae TaxID=1672749 RepID=A0A1Q9AJ92_9HYPH|nr:DUF2336 domain-containing protein [Xaviernesmea rhizosphaerae]OLP55342.1 hypothetical protein BJF92_22540 [Xaviernesmea rhizosphaerae]